MSISQKTHETDSANALNTFARTQLSHVSQHHFIDSTFLVLATCAFFYGAEAQLRKQSQISFHAGQVKLVAFIKAYFKMNTRTALHIVLSIDDYAKKYYLIETIVTQGEKHAEKWLNCEESDDHYIEKLTAQYQCQSMFDLGIESISEEYESQQKKMFSSVNQSVRKLRKRLAIILTIAVLALGAILSLALR